MIGMDFGAEIGRWRKVPQDVEYFLLDLLRSNPYYYGVIFNLWELPLDPMTQIRKRFELPLYKPTGALRLTARSGDQEGSWLVFLEVARTLPGKVKIIL